MGQSLNDLDDMDDGTFFAKRDSEGKNSTLSSHSLWKLNPHVCYLDEDGQLDKHTVARANFGGFGDEEESDRKKTKAEIMKEIIAKSKFHKVNEMEVVNLSLSHSRLFFSCNYLFYQGRATESQGRE